VAGINGEAVERKLTLDLGPIGAGGGGLITDGAGQSFQQRTISPRAGQKIDVALRPNGGFVLRLE